MTALAAAMACMAAQPASAATVYGLDSSQRFLLRFDSATPGTIDEITPITGLAAFERIVGLDFRPRTGQLFGIGEVDGAGTDTIRTYVIDARTGAATLVPGSTPFSVLDGFSYGVDFNPTVDRIRVFNDADENFRINPNTGARADAPVNDTDINPAGSLLSGGGYDRSFDTGLAVMNRTTLYSINPATSSLVTIGGINQTPSPNGGLILNPLPLGVTLSSDDVHRVGFDIAGTNDAFASLVDGTELNRLFSINLATGAATALGTIADGSLGVSSLAVPPASSIAVGHGSGAPVRARTQDGATLDEELDLVPFRPGFTGGTRVALADVNRDGVPDLIAGSGPGGTRVRVFDGTTGDPLPGVLGGFRAFQARFNGGVFVAGGDVNADGNKDVIVGRDAGSGPRVAVFSGATGELLSSFLAFDAGFRGGVRVASADFDKDGDYEIVVGAGPGAGPRLRILDSTGAPATFASLPGFKNDFLAFATNVTTGIFVASGDLNGDGTPDIVASLDAGAPPRVRVFDGATGNVISSFLAYSSSFRGGVRVAVADVDADGRYEVVVAPGAGGTPLFRAFDPISRREVGSFFAFDPRSSAEFFVGGVRR